MKAKAFYFIGAIFLILMIGYFFKAEVFKQRINSQDNKLQVSASFYPTYYFASQIGGDKVTVRNITPAGAEPHDYDLTTGDIAKIEDGRMLILNGSFEPWGDKIMGNLKGTNVKVVVVGEGLLTGELAENGETIKDPHVWLDPQLAKKETEKITEGFVAVDRANASYYETNQKELLSKLDQIDHDFKKGLESCKKRDIVTSHAAFAYLAQRYGLIQVAISGLSPDEEPSAQQLAFTANFARENDVKYIFFESLLSPKLSDTIASEVGAKTLVLDTLEGLSDDDISSGKNYFSVMQDNLSNLKFALECN